MQNIFFTPKCTKWLLGPTTVTYSTTLWKQVKHDGNIQRRTHRVSFITLGPCFLVGRLTLASAFLVNLYGKQIICIHILYTCFLYQTSHTTKCTTVVHVWPFMQALPRDSDPADALCLSDCCSFVHFISSYNTKKDYAIHLFPIYECMWII